MNMNKAIKTMNPKKRGIYSYSKKLTTLLVASLVVFVYGCASNPGTSQDIPPEAAGLKVEQLMVVDCLLPGQVRQLGSKLTYLTPRRPIKTTASDCEIRGGEYVSFDRSNYATALKIWLPQAKAGDAEAQTYVGEIFEKGLGIQADYQIAASWYKKAADQGHSRAQINLGYLYEGGLGVERDLTTAMNWYRQASGLTDGDLEFVSSIEAANRQAKSIEHENLKEENENLKAELEQTKTKLASGKESLGASQQRIVKLKSDLVKKREQLAKAEKEKLSVPQATKQQIVVVNTADPVLTKKLERAETEKRRLTNKLAKEQLAKRKVERRQQQTLAALEQSKLELGNSKSELELAQTQLGQQKSILSGTSEDTQKLAELNQKVLDLQKSVEQKESATVALEARSAGEQVELEKQIAGAKASEDKLRLALDTSNTEVDQLKAQLSAVNAANEKKLAENELRIAKAEKELQLALEKRNAEVSLLQQQLTATEVANVEKFALVDKNLKAAKNEQKRLTSKLAVQRLASRKNVNAQIAQLEKDLQQQEGLVFAQRTELEALEGQLLQTQARLKNEPGTSVVATISNGPVIEIIDPPLLATRGTPQINLRSAVPEIEIIGRVESAIDLLSFRINDQTAKIESNGLFRINQAVRKDSTPVNLVAVDQQGQRTALEFLLNPKAGVAVDAEKQKFGAQSIKGVNFGNYHALVIGNNRYKSLTNLNTAENDANVIAGILESKYGFNTTTLINADRYTMLSALNKLRETLTEEDNLLIYYAGHGELDKVNLRGYWLPVDSESDSSTNWISNVAITDILNVMTAKHILVVADSCYSGSMTRSSVARLEAGLSNEAKKKWYTAMNKTKARAVLTSGGVKPVLDTGGGDHSIFAKAFIDVLNENDGILEGFKLFREVQQRVKTAAAALNVDQEPQYSPIKYAGHEAGEFFLLPGSNASAIPRKPSREKLLASIQ